MSKISGSSTVKSTRDKFDELLYGELKPADGWKTENQWSIELGMKTNKFRSRVKILLDIGKAKKKMFMTKNHGMKVHYWIEKLS